MLFFMLEADYLKWKAFLSHKKNKDVYLTILENFKDSNFPFIINLTHFSKLVGIKSSELNNMIYITDSFYREFEIPKKRGGTRKISSPYPSLSFIQNWILKNILEKIYLNSSATAYVKNKSILDNVTPHLSQNFILKIDLKDFFPSLKIARIIQVFRNCGYSQKVAYILARICCLDNSLPQGACTSPYLANIISKRMDSRLYSFCTKFDLKYTRYADDITISGSDINWKQCEYIINIIENEGFDINKEKTKLISGSKKIITGISINSDTPKLPRKTKRELRHNAYIVLHLSKEEYMNTLFKENPMFIESLIGKYNYWLFIEKENTYVKETLKKLKEYSIMLSS